MRPGHFRTPRDVGRSIGFDAITVAPRHATRRGVRLVLVCCLRLRRRLCDSRQSIVPIDMILIAVGDRVADCRPGSGAVADSCLM